MGISFGENKQLYIGHCKFLTTTVGLCMRPTSGGKDRCKTHEGKKEVKKNPQKKFRGKSKFWKGFKGAVE